MKIDDYIHQEFRKVFPKAFIEIQFTEDEKIIVDLKEKSTSCRYVMEIGSDDDEFSFHNIAGDRIAFPVPNEPFDE